MTQERTFRHCEERSDEAILIFSTAPKHLIILYNRQLLRYNVSTITAETTGII